MTTYNQSPSDSIQLVGLGDLPSPASCVVCGNGNYEMGYVLLGVWVDFVGNLMLCGDCVTQVAERYNMLTQEEAIIQQGLLSTAVSTLEITKVELEAANERLAILDDLFSRIGINPAVTPAGGLPAEAVSNDVSDQSESSDAAVSISDGPESESVKSASKPGQRDISKSARTNPPKLEL